MGGGDYFPPPILLQVGGSYATKLSKSGGARRGTWRGGGGDLPVRLLRWRFCGGGRWRCRGSRTAAPRSGAAVSSGGERDSCSSLLLRFLSPSSATFPFLFVPVYVCVFQLPFLFLFRYRPSPLSLTVPLLYLSQSLSPVSSFPFFFLFFFFRSLSFLLFSFSSLRSLFCSLSSSCVLALGGIYRAKGAGASLLPPYCRAWGAGLCCPATTSGWLASGRGWQGAAPPVSHHEGAWGFRFGRARGEGDGHEELKKKKTKSFFLPLLRVQGKKKAE